MGHDAICRADGQTQQLRYFFMSYMYVRSQTQEGHRHLDFDASAASLYVTKCNDQHEHVPWGKTATGFATAEECAYNDHLCAAWAEAIYEFALANNFVPSADLGEQATPQSTAAPALNKAILGCLPRGRVPPFMSEFLEPQI